MKVDWIVLNQTYFPAFQEMLGRLAGELGRCLCYTGTPFPAEDDLVVVEAGPSYDRRSVRRRVVSWGRFTAAALARAARVRGRPLVLAATNPPSLPHVAWMLHRLRGFPYVLLFWDIYPDHMVQAGLVGERSRMARGWAALNRKSMLEAEAVITIGEGMAGVLRAQLGPDAARCRIEVIPNWVDTDRVRPLAKHENPFAIDQGQEDRVTVLYSGNMGHTHGMGALVEAAHRLRDDSRISFLLIGDGMGKQEVAEGVRRHGLTNVRLLPFQPEEVLPYSLATGDIAIVMQAPGSEHLSLPSKTYSLMAAGCALVACTRAGSDLARLVGENRLGAVCPPGNPESLAAAIRDLAGNPERLARCRDRSRGTAIAHFGSDAVYTRFLEVLRRDRAGLTATAAKTEVRWG